MLYLYGLLLTLEMVEEMVNSVRNESDLWKTHMLKFCIACMNVLDVPHFCGMILSRHVLIADSSPCHHSQ